MPIQYNPTDSRFLTVAQSRTNNGQKDIRIILDIPTNDFYSLDDDGNFSIIGYAAGTPTLADVLTAGNITGGLSITSPDGLTVLDVADSTLNTQLTDGGNYEHTTFMQSFNYIRTVTDLNTSNAGNVYVAPDDIDLAVIDSVNSVTNNLNIETSSISINYVAPFISNQIGADSNLVVMVYTDSTNQITSSIVGDAGKVQLGYVDGISLIDNRFQVSKDGYYIKDVPAFADDSAAGTAGLTPGFIFQTDGSGAAPLNVVGLLMIKQ